MQTNLSNNGKSSINMTYLKTREEIESYIHKLRKYYDIDYHEVDVKYDEENNIYLDYNLEKPADVIKVMPIKESRKFNNILKCGIVSIT